MEQWLNFNNNAEKIIQINGRIYFFLHSKTKLAHFLSESQHWMNEFVMHKSANSSICLCAYLGPMIRVNWLKAGSLKILAKLLSLDLFFFSFLWHINTLQFFLNIISIKNCTEGAKILIWFSRFLILPLFSCNWGFRYM